MPAAGPIKSIPIDAVTGTNQVLVAAVAAAGLNPAQKIRIRSLEIGVSANGTVKFHDDAGSPTILTGAVPITTAQPLVLPDNPEGWGDTASGQALQVDTPVTINGELSYHLID